MINIDQTIKQYGHIVSHFDGNAADTDDIGALSMSALLLNAAGLADKSTIFYNNLLGLVSDPEQVRLMRKSADFAEKLGVQTHDYEANANQATQKLVEIFNSGEKVLSICHLSEILKMDVLRWRCILLGWASTRRCCSCRRSLG